MTPFDPSSHRLMDRLTPWERNFLRLYARGQVEAVRVELGSMKAREGTDRAYGELRERDDCERVLAAIRAKLELNVGAPKSNGSSPLAEQPEPQPEPQPEDEPMRPVAPDEDEPGEPPGEPPTGLDDLGNPRPGETRVGSRWWRPRATKRCLCGRRFWPTHPRNVYCSECRGQARKPSRPRAPAGPAEREVSRRVAAQVQEVARELDELQRHVRRLAPLEAEVEALRAEVAALRALIDAPDVDSLDVTLGAVVAALAMIGRGELEVRRFVPTLREEIRP